MADSSINDSIIVTNECGKLILRLGKIGVRFIIAYMCILMPIQVGQKVPGSWNTFTILDGNGAARRFEHYILIPSNPY